MTRISHKVQKQIMKKDENQQRRVGGEELVGTVTQQENLGTQLQFGRCSPALVSLLRQILKTSS